MAVTLTLEQLADHLRIERAAVGINDPRRTLLVELLQAGTHTIERCAPDAPTDVQNLAASRFAGYSYDAPPAPSGAAYAAVFVNSGAAHLLNPWRTARAALVPTTGGTDAESMGDDAAAISISIMEHDTSPAAHQYLIDLIAGLGTPTAPVILQAERVVTNAEFKAMDDTYLEMVPAPGVGKYLQIEQVWMRKDGHDQPTAPYPRMYHVAISVDDTLTPAEASAGNSATFTFVDIPPWTSGQRFVFVGVPVTDSDLASVTSFTVEEADVFFARVFERVPGTIITDGVPVKWWRTKVAYDSPEDIFDGNAYIVGWTPVAGPSLETLVFRTFLALFLEETLVPAPAKPLSVPGNELVWISGNNLGTIAAADDGREFAEAIDGHGLLENKPVVLGFAVNGARAAQSVYYSATAFNAYLTGADDLAFGIVIQYQIHDVATPPT